MSDDIRVLSENRVLKDTANADIDAASGAITSESVKIPGISGFAIHVYGTSATQVDVELTSVPDVSTSWVCAKTEASPTLPLIIEINDTNLPYARVKITGGSSVTARICKVDE